MRLVAAALISAALSFGADRQVAITIFRAAETVAAERSKQSGK
jgi:hypothetical protein